MQPSELGMEAARAGRGGEGGHAQLAGAGGGVLLPSPTSNCALKFDRLTSEPAAVGRDTYDKGGVTAPTGCDGRRREMKLAVTTRVVLSTGIRPTPSQKVQVLPCYLYLPGEPGGRLLCFALIFLTLTAFRTIVPIFHSSKTLCLA
jgi:hypothetical protein